MQDKLNKFRSDLITLVQLGEEMLVDLSLRDAVADAEQHKIADRVKGSFERNYQRWYTEAGAVVGQLIHARAAEIERLYMGEAKRRSINAETYNIQDWLAGRRAPADGSGKPAFNDLLAVSMRLKMQLDILRSAEARLESSLFDVRQLVRADLFDSQLDACRELAVHGFLRAAGTVAGVVLEKHLRQVAESHGVAVRNSEPTLNDFNDHLKKAGLLDVPTWRQIQRLADIRNLCGHQKHREPRGKEVKEMIEGVDGIIRTLF
ncbi:MAG: hypothetical protein K8R46_01470 [Pirellulales bacterium]|nr:hypothetical protein [Pirellulales bacterium]